MPPEPDISTVQDILMKYFDARLNSFDAALLGLRADYKEQTVETNKWLKDISDKLEIRMETLENAQDEMKMVQLSQGAFISNIKWVIGFLVACVTAVIGNSANGFFHFVVPTIPAAQQIPVPAPTSLTLPHIP